MNVDMTMTAAARPRKRLLFGTILHPCSLVFQKTTKKVNEIAKVFKKAASIKDSSVEWIEEPVETIKGLKYHKSVRVNGEKVKMISCFQHELR